jgi:hypothetical protein
MLPPPTVEESTAEPVMTVEWWKTAVITLALALVSVLGALDVWHPSDDQVTAITAASAAVVAVAFPLIAFFVRKRVTPVKES